VDVVINLTIPDAHYAVTKRILEAGKHAYSEKPLVLTLDEGTTLRDLAKAKGLAVGCAPDTFLGGAHQQARALMDEGRIGTITSAVACVQNHGPEGWHPKPGVLLPAGRGADAGPGALLHCEPDQLPWPGSPRGRDHLVADADADHRLGRAGGAGDPGQDADEHPCSLEFHSGAVVNLTTSWDVWHHKRNHFEFYGTEGTLYVPDPNFFGGTVEVADKAGTLTELAPWEHPFGVPNQEHPQARAAGELPHGGAGRHGRGAAGAGGMRAAAWSGRCTGWT
jgi:predicted dehydrogenase